jgi:hypothetical protein
MGKLFRLPVLGKPIFSGLTVRERTNFFGVLKTFLLGDVVAALMSEGLMSCNREEPRDLP